MVSALEESNSVFATVRYIRGFIHQENTIMFTAVLYCVAYEYT